MSILFSYPDPGTGSVVIQAVIGAIAGVSIFGRKAISGARYKMKSIFSKGRNRKS